jgi:hypothetical protein
MGSIDERTVTVGNIVLTNCARSGFIEFYKQQNKERIKKNEIYLFISTNENRVDFGGIITGSSFNVTHRFLGFAYNGSIFSS